MDLYELNRLIEKIATIQGHLSKNENDPLLLENLQNHIALVNARYGIYLNDLLFEVYDEYCEDNEVQSIDRYLSPEGVPVEADDFPGVQYRLKLKAFPLRFELENKEMGNYEVVWRAA